MIKNCFQYAMRRPSRLVLMLTLPLLAPLLSAPTHAIGVRAPVQQQQFGIVDFQDCAAKSKLKTELDMQYAQYKNSVLAIFNKLKEGNAIFLNKQEMNELAAIYEKVEKATDAEKKRAMDLQTKADQRAGTLNRLEQTSQPKPEEKKEMESLNQMRNDGIPILNDIGTEYTRRIEEKGKTFEEQLEKIVKDAVKKVAQEKSLAMVFNANVVIYAAVDITPDVIKILQK